MATAFAKAVLVSIQLPALAEKRSSRSANKWLTKRSFSEGEAQTWGARCLDGTPYAYYVGAPISGTPSDWIIYLDGGGECETHGDCLRRSRGPLGTATVLPNRVRRVSVDDMLSTEEADNPDFHAFGALYLPYLSGDDWLGAEPSACVPWGARQTCSGNRSSDEGRQSSYLAPLTFAGHRNFEAAIHFWRESLPAPPRTVLLTGGSAGGQGAFFHADRLVELLPETTVKANPQYGWFGATTDTYPDWLRGVHTRPSLPYPSSASPIAIPAWMYNITVFLPPRCLAALAPHERETPLLCATPPRVALSVAAPLFVSTNLFDGWFAYEMEMLPEGKLGPTADTDPKLRYLLTVTAPDMRNSVYRATAARPQLPFAAFVPACVDHPMTWRGPSAPRLGASNCTHGAAVASWFFGRGDCERYLIDQEDRPHVLAAMPCNSGVFRKDTQHFLFV